MKMGEHFFKSNGKFISTAKQKSHMQDIEPGFRINKYFIINKVFAQKKEKIVNITKFKNNIQQIEQALEISVL